MNNIIYLSGVARSGTSWLGQLFNSSPDVCFRFQPLFSYEFKNRVHEDSSKSEFQQLLNEIHRTSSPFLTQEDKCLSGEYPVFKKHDITPILVIKENRYQHIIEPMMRKCRMVKLVGIIRNPKAVLNSWINLPKEFPPGSDPLKEWRYGDCKNQGHEDFFGYYKWKEIANLYLDLHAKWPNRVFVLRYEDLVLNTKDIVKDLFLFSSIPYTTQTDSFALQSSNELPSSPYSVFKDKRVIDKWKNGLSSYIANEIDEDLKGTRLAKFIKE